MFAAKAIVLMLLVTVTLSGCASSHQYGGGSKAAAVHGSMASIASSPAMSHWRGTIGNDTAWLVRSDHIMEGRHVVVPTCGPVRDGIGLGLRDPALCDTTWSPPVPLADAIADFRDVDPEGPMVRTARGLGICLGDA